ncbi:MAG: hypothetical protein Q7S27_07570 [Nanoarchaeota archaeon]|nr:hypothetical protein [Nanoarchaeota archaeon]
MKLTQRQEAVILGTILGDGYLQKTGLKNARLRLEHGDAQKEYVLWKGSQFPKLFLGKPVYLERTHPKTNRVYKYWRWQSNSTPVLGKWHSLFYKNNKKCLPKNLSELLQESLALAVWYMDDGSFYQNNHNRYSMIYLGRVSSEEAKIAAEAVARNFDIHPKVYDKKQKGYALFFPVTETKKLHDLIRPYMLPLFNYKLYSL